MQHRPLLDVATVWVMEKVTKTGNTVSSDHVLESANQNCN